jgi:hypothetical protein
MRSFAAPYWWLPGWLVLVASMAQPGPESPPLPPSLPSPVAAFRELLALDEAGRTQALETRSESQRRSIQAKLIEYDALPREERELRLRATELSWYLRPLLKANPAERPTLVAQVPAPLRSLVERRLASWDRLTPRAQQDFLRSDWALHYFLRLEISNPAEGRAQADRLEAESRRLLERELARWQALPPQQRQRTAEQFHQFFQLPFGEQVKTLNTVPAAEREKVQATLDAFGRLPAARRQATLEAFHRFANLPVAERIEFLRNANRWKEMSPEDRATWRRLVPELPPVPPGLFEPPLPPVVSPRGDSGSE